METDRETANLDNFPYKLEAEFPKKGVVVNRVGERRRWLWAIEGKETWRWVKDLGAGGFGVVWLEKEKKTQKLRAVKRMTLRELTSKGVNFKRELETLITLRDVSTLSGTPVTLEGPTDGRSSAS